MCIYHSVDIDPLPTTVGLDFFVLAPLDPTECTMGIMLRMSTISVINGRFSLIFGEFCLDKSQELLLCYFIGFARYSLWFFVDEIESAKEMPQSTDAVRDIVCYINVLRD